MTQTIRKFFAAILLILLLGVPFINWRLGAVLWMCAWLIYIFQKVFPVHRGEFGEGEESDEQDDEEL